MYVSNYHYAIIIFAVIMIIIVIIITIISLLAAEDLDRHPFPTASSGFHRHPYIIVIIIGLLLINSSTYY